MLTRCISRSEIPSKNAPNIWEMVIGQLIHGLGATDFFFLPFFKENPSFRCSCKNQTNEKNTLKSEETFKYRVYLFYLMQG